MPDGVPPTLTSVSKVGKVVKNILIDICQHKLLLWAAEYCHGYQANVGMLGLGLIWEWDPKESWIQLGHREHGKICWRTESLVDNWETWSVVSMGGLQEGGQRIVELGQ